MVNSLRCGDYWKASMPSGSAGPNAAFRLVGPTAALGCVRGARCWPLHCPAPSSQQPASATLEAGVAHIAINRSHQPASRPTSPCPLLQGMRDVTVQIGRELGVRRPAKLMRAQSVLCQNPVGAAARGRRLAGSDIVGGVVTAKRIRAGVTVRAASLGCQCCCGNGAWGWPQLPVLCLQPGPVPALLTPPPPPHTAAPPLQVKINPVRQAAFLAKLAEKYADGSYVAAVRARMPAQYQVGRPGGAGWRAVTGQAMHPSPASLGT